MWAGPSARDQCEGRRWRRIDPNRGHGVCPSRRRRINRNRLDVSTERQLRTVGALYVTARRYVAILGFPRVALSPRDQHAN
jgi:hypothetical protein